MLPLEMDYDAEDKKVDLLKTEEMVKAKIEVKNLNVEVNWLH